MLFEFFSSLSLLASMEDCRVLEADEVVFVVVVEMVDVEVFEFRSESDVVFGEANFST